MIELIFSLVCIIAFSVIIYWPTLKFGLVCDDIEWYDSLIPGTYLVKWQDCWNKPWRWPDALRRSLYGGGTFGTNNIPLDHAFTMFLHTLTCVLIYWVLGCNTISYWAAVLYCCNPINHQTAIWLNGRRYAVATICALLFYKLGVWGSPFYFFSGLFHYTAFLTPVLLITKSPWYLLLIPIYAALGYIAVRDKYNGRKPVITCNDQLHFNHRRLFIIIKCYGFGFFQMFGLGEVLMIYPVIENWGITEEGNKHAYSFNFDYWKGILAIILSIAGLFYFKNEILAMWIFICLSGIQWSGIIPAVQLNTDRYNSISNIFMSYILVFYASKFLGDWGEVFILLLSCYYCYKLPKVLEMYRNINDFYDYHIKSHPQMICVRGAKITNLIREQKLQEAWLLLDEGLKYNPTDYSFLLLTAVVCVCSGSKHLALHYLNQADKHYYIGKEQFEKAEIAALRMQIEQIPDNSILKGTMK